MPFIDQWINTIINNLPEWNHSQAKNDPLVRSEIKAFKQATVFINRQKPFEEQLKKLAQIVALRIADNHITLKDKNNQPLIPFPPIQQNNLALNKERLPTPHFIKKITVQKNQPDWLIISLLDMQTGIVAIPSFGGDITTQTKARQDFITAFFEQKKQQNWQRIIFDFRGNTGGDSMIIKEIAERMSGKQIKYADKIELLNTLAGQKKQSEGYELPQEKTYSSLEPDDKYSGRILILQDRYNASATEGAIYMLTQLENTTTIGENTAGTFKGGATTTLSLPEGNLVIGTVYLERTDKNQTPVQEKKGLSPDIYCLSERAFETACLLIKNEEKSKNTATLNTPLHQYRQANLKLKR